MPTTRIEQAVILAGGLGTRMRPITDTVPKPMIQIHERPFLEYLIEELARHGIERVVLLLGYLPDIVREHFGDGRKFGVRIDYSVSAVEDETGSRIRKAEHLMDPVFLLMYCDNYWPLRLGAMTRTFDDSGAAAQITAYRNADGYTRSNVRVGEQGLVDVYDRSRTAPGLAGVDIGFALVRKEALRHIPGGGNPSFESTVYPALVAASQLGAYVTDHRYYSIGSPERVESTERFFERRPAIILDRDGVLNVRPPKAEYVTSADEFRWLPGAKEALALLKGAGYMVVVVSNQAGIARGALSEGALAEIHDRMRRDAEAAGGGIDAVYYCPHGWDDGCDCRKPNPGMLFAAQHDMDLDLSRTYFIGDDPRDVEAGEAAGCPTLLVTDSDDLLGRVRRDVLGTMSGRADREEVPHV